MNDHSLGDDKDPQRIEAMFDSIAGRYDFLNHLLTIGLDIGWRSRAVEALELSGNEIVLDACTGTGDLAITALRGRYGQARHVVGVDFSERMLRVGYEKVRKESLRGTVAFVRGDVTHIPLPSDSVDAAAIAFGIRNVKKPKLVCKEIHRVLRRGGRLAILEFGIPDIPGLRTLYLWYFRVVLPKLGSLISRHGSAYSYLPASVARFPSPEVFAAELKDAGFSKVNQVRLAFGITLLYVAHKPLVV